MRKFTFPLIVLFCLSFLSAQAQQTTVIVEDATETEDQHLKIGALAGLTLAMNTTDYNVQRVTRSLGLGSNFGVRASIPIGQKTRFVTGLGYHTLTFSDENERISFNDNIKDHSIDLPGTLTTEGTFQYTVFTAMFQFSSVFVGVNIGLPTSSEMKNSATGFDIPDGGIDPTDWYTPPRNEFNPDGRLIKKDITPEDDDINTLIELRLGGEFPLSKTAIGDLNLGISVGYTFQNIIKDSRDNLPHMHTNFWLPNVLFHLSYLFNI
ncbi:MAG: hypothetical protein C0600_02360 [Ignavibacteria bacterium]|nr:MAG: hypothetical protein C0600_02360 [Ignavibacteria bacterium]